MNANEKRKLGRTDVELTQFGFGAASLGEIFALVSEEDTLSTLQTLWKHGVCYIDMAPFYGFGLSEHRGAVFCLNNHGRSLFSRLRWDAF